MKDPTRHLRNIQRKVMRFSRQETTSLPAPANEIAPEKRLSESKRSRRLLVPKLVKAQAYH